MGWSVMQGSELSGIIFIIYISEVPKIHELLKDESLMKVMVGEHKKITDEISHETINFIDDSASIVTFKEEEEAIEYIRMFINILNEYYNINKLKLNKEKTALLLFIKPKSKVKEKEVNIKNKRKRKYKANKSTQSPGLIPLL